MIRGMTAPDREEMVKVVKLRRVCDATWHDAVGDAATTTSESECAGIVLYLN